MPNVLVLIDESGDPGFKVARGSSPVFVVAMVIFDDFEEAERTSATIGQLRQQLRVKPEFKFNKCHGRVRDGFFQGIARHRFQVRALVVVKDRIDSQRLRTETGQFYHFFVQMLLKHDDGLLTGARIKIDGSGDRQFKQELQTCLRHQLGERMSDFKFADSRRDNLVQLADMSAGAIARSYNPERKDATRWRDMLAQFGKIGDIQEFR